MKAFISNFLQINIPLKGSLLSRGGKIQKKKTLEKKMVYGEPREEKLNFSSKPNHKKEKYLEVNTQTEEVILKLQQFQVKEDFLKFCYFNREHLSYDLLYRLTVLKLRSEGNQDNTGQIQKVEEFRKKILESTLVVDQAVAQSLILGEKRIKDILNKSQNFEIVEKNIGEDRISVSCFWIVLFASLVAWEKKIFMEGQIDSSGTYQKLLNIKNIFEKSERHQNLLAIELKKIQNKLTEEEEKGNSPTLDIDSLSGLKLIIVQLEKLPSSSYGPLLVKISKIYNQTFLKFFGIRNGNFQKQYTPFVPTPIKTKSKLVEIQQNK